MNKYTVIHSSRRTVSIEISDNLEIIVRAPDKLSDSEIEKLILSYDWWIKKHSKIKEERIKNSKIMNLTDKDVEKLKLDAERYIPDRVFYFSNLMRLIPSGIKITRAKKRFGSCSGKNSLCFSLYLMAYPEEAVDYVVVHELAHIKYKNHSKAFYKLIEGYLPDYKKREALLKQF